MLSLAPELLIEDLPKTITWYQSVLGFEVMFLMPDSSEPTFARIRRGTVEIMLFQRIEFAQEISSFATTPMGGSFVLYLEVKKIQTEWTNIKNKVKVIQPLYTTDYGSNEFTIVDCNGYHLTFGERN